MTLTSPNSQGIVLSDSSAPFEPAYEKALQAFGGKPPSAKDLINLTEYLRENAPKPVVVLASPEPEPTKPEPSCVGHLRGKQDYREAPSGTVAEGLEKRNGLWLHRSTGALFNDGHGDEPHLPFARREVTVWGSEPEVKQPHKIGAGDRVIFAHNSTGQVGRGFAKGTTGVVHNTFTADLDGPSWVGKHEAVNVTIEGDPWPTTVKVADLIVYKAVTEMPQDGDELVILAEPWMGKPGDIVSVLTRRATQSPYVVNTQDHGGSHVMGRDDKSFPTVERPSRRYGLVVR